MIELKEKTLQSFLYKAKETAQRRNKSVLMSWTKAIEPNNLLLIFEAAESLRKDRLFWRNHKGTFTLVGIGTVQQIVAKQNRFEQLQAQWEEILQQAVVHNPFKTIGTGLITVGGMSFDPERPMSRLWEKYPPSQLTIPEYIFTRHKDKFYMTVNCYINQEEDIEILQADIEQMEENLLSSNKLDNHFATHKIIAKKEIEPELWKKKVMLAVEEINQNRAKKIVLAREMRLKLDREANISLLLNKLQESQPNSYIFAIEHEDNCFIGATPERLVQVEGNRLLSTCLAGTARRGNTHEEDKRLAYELLHDEKNRKEHDYVVQMMKESIETYCVDINIPKEPVVYPLRNLQHLYTPVRATLKTEFTVFDIIARLHPTPALGGVPREKALKFIRENEILDRGWYGAPVGWLDSNQNSEFAVAIRSGLIQKDEISLFAGCGVMGDSEPEMEYEETNVKFLPMLTILEE